MVILWIASKARHFSEAQSLIAPLYIVSLIPGVVAISTQAELDWQNAWIPVYNVVLALRAILSGDVPMGPFLLTLATLAVSATVMTAILGGRLARYARDLGGP